MGVIRARGCVEDGCDGVEVRGVMGVHVCWNSFCCCFFNCMAVVPESVSEVIFGHANILD